MDDLNKYVDLETALNRIRGNKKLYARLIGLFLKNPEFENFDSFIENKDYEKAGESAHAIKGMTGNLSLTALFEESTTLMTQLRQGEFDSELYEQFKKDTEITKNHLTELMEEFSQA